MIVLTIICSTKGGVGKTTLTANLAGFLMTRASGSLLVADIQPTLSSYYPLHSAGRGRSASTDHHGLYPGAPSAEHKDTRHRHRGLGRPRGQHRRTGSCIPRRLVRMRYALPRPAAIRHHISDTQGAVGPLQDAGVLAADPLLSPIPNPCPRAGRPR